MTFLFHNSYKIYIIVFTGPEFLTITTSGPAGELWSRKMGVYRQSGETHNKRPVWSRLDGKLQLFYDNGKFCDDNNEEEDCVLINNDIIENKWVIGNDPASDGRFFSSLEPAEDRWPDEVLSWKYRYIGGSWQLDDELSVTGNIDINFPCLNIISNCSGMSRVPHSVQLRNRRGEAARQDGSLPSDEGESQHKACLVKA